MKPRKASPAVIGVVATHYDARNDVRELVNIIALRNRVILFGDERMRTFVGSDHEYRTVRVESGLWAWLWYYLFSFFGKIPRCSENFLITELFKLDGLPSAKQRRVKRRLRIRLMLPKFISYDFLLQRVKETDRTDLSGIDAMVFITAISTGPLLARAKRSAIPYGVYVYSWDHACKHPAFSREVEKYWVWNQGIVRDLVELQNIDASKVRIIGSTQLTYVKKFCADETRRNQVRGSYVYYGCGVGHASMAAQEIALVSWLAAELATVAPNIRLLVRPYPMLADTEIFRIVRQLPNVDIDESFRQNKENRSLSSDQIMTKLSLQEGAIAFIHCGTTMGFEGAYLDTPIIFLAPEDFPYGVGDRELCHLKKFIGQYHNLKYMIDVPGRNVVRRVRDLAPLLRDVVANPTDFLEYNRTIRGATPLRSMEEIVEAILLDILPDRIR